MVIAPAILMGLFLAQAPDAPPPGHAPVAPPPAVSGQGGRPAPRQAPPPPAGKPDERPTDPAETETPVVTHHQITVAGKALKYTATAGMMPLKGATGEVEARIFYIAYTVDTPAGSPKRPLLFAFNGGPGSASVWLHLGTIGPRRVKMMDDGHMPPPPFELVDNQSTWLRNADLVFIDPVGTGYSHADKPENNRNYWGVRQDLRSVGDFIRLYITRNDRWSSPLFVAGESYGTFRAAGLAGDLIDNGIALNGVVLISTVLNLSAAGGGSGGNDLTYPQFLPTFTAAAWYHKRLPADLEARDLKSVVTEVRQWANTDYLLALNTGDALPQSDRRAVIDRMARYTGLDKTFIDNVNLRVGAERFYKELLRDRHRTIGRYDARMTGIDPDNAAEYPDYDPSEAVARPPFTMTFNEYVRTELGFKTDREYEVLTGIGPWDWGQRGPGSANMAEALRAALAKNPYLKVYVAEGYYDMATPWASVEYTFSHMNLDPSMKGSIVSGQYAAGHMMYLDAVEREKLNGDVGAFIDGAVKAKPAR
ncbi:MAG TPA: peptidase S10 [Armatimonadota bacterium]